MGAREGVISHLQINGDSTSVDCYGRKITFPVQARDALQFALSQSEFVARDIPGDLDEAGKLALLRRLVREGLLVFRAT